MKGIIRYFGLCLLLLSVNLSAETHKPHVHGLATLTLVLENELLAIEFESPAANLTGFEYKALSEKEKSTVKGVEAFLNSPAGLFSWAGADCQLKNTVVDVSGVMDDAHDAEDHHDHGHGHAQEESQGAAHSEIRSHYYFVCNDADNLTSVSVEGLMRQFPGIETIKAMWVKNRRQGSMALKPDSSTLYLR